MAGSIGWTGAGLVARLMMLFDKPNTFKVDRSDLITVTVESFSLALRMMSGEIQRDGRGRVIVLIGE